MRQLLLLLLLAAVAVAQLAGVDFASDAAYL
jgi:hypothetical protein